LDYSGQSPEVRMSLRAGRDPAWSFGVEISTGFGARTRLFAKSSSRRHGFVESQFVAERVQQVHAPSVPGRPFHARAVVLIVLGADLGMKLFDALHVHVD